MNIRQPAAAADTEPGTRAVRGPAAVPRTDAQPQRGDRGGADPATAAHRRRRPRGGRVEDRGVVRLQQPGSAGAGDGEPDPGCCRFPRLPPAPGRADAHPAPDPHAGRAHPAGAVGDLLQPVLRGLLGGRRAGRRAGGLRAPLHLAAPRLARPGDGPRHRGRRGRHRPVRGPPRGGADPGGRRAAGDGGLERAAGPAGASRSTTRAAPAPPRSTCCQLGHREILVVGVEPPSPGAELEPDGVMGRRLARLPGRPRRPRRGPARPRGRRRPGEHRGRHRGHAPRLRGRPAADRACW